MHIPKPIRSLTPAQRRRLTSWASVRILATSLGLVALYYLAPLDRLGEASVTVSLSVALLVLAGVTAWQVRSITRADFPAVRAAEALSVTTPLFLLLFAAAYFLLAQDNPENFHPDTPLTRTDTLYFTVTIFATVGFGDITAASEAARLIVTAQMLLDLLVLGLVLRLFLGAVRSGERQQSDTATDSPS
ncbi:potassium channel family protein [Streptomyces sp. NPDC058463]|uniref:potassium channel family protein n=1 Tax=Streptomyces sp. NPDC058463 TaxID=3346510 RepID=UPI003662CD4E